MKATEAKKAIKIINDLLENGEYGYYGIRIDTDTEYAIGDWAADSRIWINGEATDNTLNGTCCVGIAGTADTKAIDRAIKLAAKYHGNRIYIIAGDSAEYGEDDGEYIIRDAKVIAHIA